MDSSAFFCNTCVLGFSSILQFKANYTEVQSTYRSHVSISKMKHLLGTVSKCFLLPPLVVLCLLRTHRDPGGGEGVGNGTKGRILGSHLY